jgi:hypothetical protein
VLYLRGMKLVVDHALSQVDGAPSGPTAGERPTLRVIQGGRACSKRLAEPRPPAKQAVAAQPEPVIDFDEVPMVLRPLPAWVPRLW